MRRPGGGGAPDRSVALSEPVRRCLEMAASGSMEGVFPRRLEDQAPLRWALERDPEDGRAALLLGHLYFALGRHADGRELWRQAARRGVEPVTALRALGMACWTLDKDPAAAAALLGQAAALDPADAVVARDLERMRAIPR